MSLWNATLYIDITIAISNLQQPRRPVLGLHKTGPVNSHRFRRTHRAHASLLSNLIDFNRGESSSSVTYPLLSSVDSPRPMVAVMAPGKALHYKIKWTDVKYKKEIYITGRRNEG